MVQKIDGFTMIELMVVILISAILLSMAVPSYQGFIKRNNVENLQDRFSTAVITARTEAASRNGPTTLCASSDGETCSQQWNDGWIVFVDDGEGTGTALDFKRHNDEQLILSFNNTGPYNISVVDETGKSSFKSLTFNTQGFNVNKERALITFCEPEGVLIYARGLIIERSGRSTMTEDLVGNDGIHESRFDDGFGNVSVSKLSC